MIKLHVLLLGVTVRVYVTFYKCTSVNVIRPLGNQIALLGWLLRDTRNPMAKVGQMCFVLEMFSENWFYQIIFRYYSIESVKK